MIKKQEKQMNVKDSKVLSELEDLREESDYGDLDEMERDEEIER